MEKSAPLLREVRGKRAEKGIWFSFFLLLASGLVALYAASYYNAQDKGSSLSEVISQLMGVGVSDYILRKRMELARRLLADTHVRIQDVAAQTGYLSAHSFTRAFRAETGISPTEWRAIAREGKM